MVLGFSMPMQLIATNTGAMTSGSECRPANAITVSVAVAQDARGDPAQHARCPKRRSSSGLSCAQQIRPNELAPKIIAYCDGVRPKPWMNTGDDPPR